jgi:adenine-specific DNA methylase
MLEWGDLFTPRQALALSVFVEKVAQVSSSNPDKAFSGSVQSCLALVLGRLADRCSSLCRYDPSPNMSGINNTFSRQALPMIWDFGEGDPTSERSGGWSQGLGWLLAALEHESKGHKRPGQVANASACEHPLPDDSATALVTDPPYYDAVPYADLSDFFFVWLKRSLSNVDRSFNQVLTPKAGECIVDTVSGKDHAFYESTMKQAMVEARRVLAPSGIGIVVFAHKSTGGWEAQLQAMVDAGWIMTGSWPIDTEMGNRLRAMDSAALASSVHIVCRPRENFDGSVRFGEIGDWRDVLQELPRRIHEWMPRLAGEGVVGADAIFACLGPALEIFARYSRVEKASGDAVTLKEYLEQVWAAVAKEALSMVFAGADASGFEPDARLTAIWLWTLNAGKSDAVNGDGDEEEEADDESEGSTKKPKTAGFVLEYDAARKIAQGLGAHLENLGSVVEVSGEHARLLPVAERARYLFGKDEGKTVVPQRKKREAQMDLFKVLEAAESIAPTFGDTTLARVGETVLDRIHQSMILFAAGRGEALKRLLIEGEAGHDPRFWRLAQALSALYPKGSDEKRWVDGILARKKGLGL